jgi:hypothetical protein
MNFLDKQLFKYEAEISDEVYQDLEAYKYLDEKIKNSLSCSCGKNCIKLNYDDRCNEFKKNTINRMFKLLQNKKNNIDNFILMPVFKKNVKNLTVRREYIIKKL